MLIETFLDPDQYTKYGQATYHDLRKTPNVLTGLFYDAVYLAEQKGFSFNQGSSIEVNSRILSVEGPLTYLRYRNRQAAISLPNSSVDHLRQYGLSVYEQ